MGMLECKLDLFKRLGWLYISPLCSIVSVLHAHLRHMDTSVKEKEKEVDAAMVARNAAFLLDTVLTLVEHKYQELTKTECPKLGKLHSNYSWLKEGKLTKYTDPNYV